MTPPAGGAVRAVVFDLGGVVIEWDPRHLYRKLFDDEAEMERFLAEVCSPAWHAPHDRGEPTEASCAALAARHPEHAERIWAWAWRSEEMVPGEVPGTAAVIDELLAAGVPCYALTNHERETYPRRRARFPVLRRFAGTVVSGFEGVAKPDPAIFELLLGRFGLEAASTLLVDDSDANVAAARSLGFRTHRFRDAARLREELVGFGLLRAPGGDRG